MFQFFPLYVKAFGLSKIEQNGKEKLYLNIFLVFVRRKGLQHIKELRWTEDKWNQAEHGLKNIESRLLT